MTTRELRNAQGLGGDSTAESVEDSRVTNLNSAGFFAYSHNFSIHGGTFIDHSIGRLNIVNNQAIDLLHRASAASAAHNSPYSPSPCHPGTREGILSLISHWINDHDNRRLCWLSGPVGTGKSAIARTISQRCEEEGRLGATFFCSRRDANRSNGTTLMLTIAYDLTQSFPSLKRPIFDRVEADPRILERAISVQFQRLIIDPLMQECDTLSRKVVVIDGLDECDDASASEIARLLSDAAENWDLPLQFLVTSRPTLCIELQFICNRSTIQPFALGNFDVHDDIRLFLTHRFKTIYRDHSIVMPEVTKPWPSADQMDRLMKMSSDLFIYASSITRFIDDHSHSPENRLNTILSAEQPSLSAYAELDQLYKQVLGGCADTKSLHLVLGTIMGLRNPLPLPAIGRLLHCRISIGDLRATLRQLRSVLLVPENEHEPITTFHQSFRDFLTDEARSREYCVNPDTYAADLAATCLDILGNPKPSGDVASYARKHYLALLRQGMVGDGHILEFFQLVACNAVIQVGGTLIVNVMDRIDEHAASAIMCWATFLVLIPAGIVGLTFIIFLIVIVPSRFQARTFTSIVLCLGEKMFSEMCMVANNGSLASSTHSISNLATAVLCALPANAELGGLIIRAVIFGVALDLVTQATVWTYAFLVNRKKPSQLSATAIWMTGAAVGRGVGAALGANAGIVYAFLALANIAIVSNFPAIYWLLAYHHHEVGGIQVVLVFQDILLPQTDSQLVHLHCLYCRWIKASYYYALKRHQIQLSMTAPLQYASLIAVFYTMTWEPTHVLPTTREAQLYCDWCT